MDQTSEELGRFLDRIWKQPTSPVFVYSPVERDGEWKKVMFIWPRDRNNIIRHMLKFSALGWNVFYSPALYSKASPKKDAVIGSWFLWVDFDGNAPTSWADIEKVPEPSFVIQSSLPGHEHCYWELDEFLMDIPLLEDRNRSLAYVLGADTSGWDADQVLRPLHTHNHKRDLPVVVKS